MKNVYDSIYLNKVNFYYNYIKIIFPDNKYSHMNAMTYNTDIAKIEQNIMLKISFFTRIGNDILFDMCERKK